MKMLYSLLSTAFQHQRDVKEQWSCWNGKTHNINMKIYTSYQFRSFALVASRQILDWANSRRDETNCKRANITRGENAYIYATQATGGFELVVCS